MDDDNSTSSNQSDYKIYYVGNDQYNDGINYVHIGEGKDEKLLLSNCYLKYHSKGIDRHMREGGNK